jgi:hypothetical protein
MFPLSFSIVIKNSSIGIKNSSIERGEVPQKTPPQSVHIPLAYSAVTTGVQRIRGD